MTLSNLLLALYIFSDLLEKYQDDKYFRDRAILAPRFDDVHKVNEMLIGQLLGEDKIYLSSESICKHEKNFKMLAELYITEIFNSIKGSGSPYHRIRLKVGSPVMLLRNIDKPLGPCNGIRLIVSKHDKHVIEVIPLVGRSARQKIITT